MPRFSVPSIRLRTLAALAVGAAAFPGASEAQTQIPPQMRGEAMALMQVCRADYDQLCSNVVPGGGRILACLQEHAGQISSGCAKAMPRAQSLRDSAVAAGVMPK
ncbi:MAG: cysteine rich repeat-containing protein [Bradyrhizobium sp.]